MYIYIYMIYDICVYTYKCTCVYSFFVTLAKRFPVISCCPQIQNFMPSLIPQSIGDATTKYHWLHNLSRIHFFIIFYCGVFRFKILVDLLTDTATHLSNLWLGIFLSYVNMEFISNIIFLWEFSSWEFRLYSHIYTNNFWNAASSNVVALRVTLWTRESLKKTAAHSNPMSPCNLSYRQGPLLPLLFLLISEPLCLKGLHFPLLSNTLAFSS